jgi:uncharacterized protein (TIGR03643 family)
MSVLPNRGGLEPSLMKNSMTRWPEPGTDMLSESCISRIIEMAWEDRTAFEAIEAQFGLNESGVIDLMRKHLKPSSFRMWRKRVSGRRTKHVALRGAVFLRHRATHTRP